MRITALERIPLTLLSKEVLFCGGKRRIDRVDCGFVRARYEVEMNAIDYLGVPQGERDRHPRAQVTTLSTKSLVPKTSHQRCPQIRHLKRGSARGGRR